ncbi:MAG: hypothetical protein WAV27_02635, partial [Xanthobacteraceae bacterium]
MTICGTITDEELSDTELAAAARSRVISCTFMGRYGAIFAICVFAGLSRIRSVRRRAIPCRETAEAELPTYEQPSLAGSSPVGQPIAQPGRNNQTVVLGESALDFGP